MGDHSAEVHITRAKPAAPKAPAELNAAAQPSESGAALIRGQHTHTDSAHHGQPAHYPDSWPAWVLWTLFCVGWLFPPCWWMGVAAGCTVGSEKECLIRRRRGLTTSQLTGWLSCVVMALVSAAGLILVCSMFFGRVSQSSPTYYISMAGPSGAFPEWNEASMALVAAAVHAALNLPADYPLGNIHVFIAKDVAAASSQRHLMAADRTVVFGFWLSQDPSLPELEAVERVLADAATGTTMAEKLVSDGFVKPEYLGQVVLSVLPVNSHVISDVISKPGQDHELVSVPLGMRISNCQGSWSTWSACNATCGSGYSTRTFNVTVRAANGGTECETNDGAMEDQPCNAALPCGYCIGAPGQSSYPMIASWDCASNGTLNGSTCGGHCLYVDQNSSAVATCHNGTYSAEVHCAPAADCQGIWSNWSTCNVSCGSGYSTRTFNITAPAANGGVVCNHTVGATEDQPCNATLPCGFCIGAPDQSSYPLADNWSCAAYGTLNGSACDSQCRFGPENTTATCLNGTYAVDNSCPAPDVYKCAFNNGGCGQICTNTTYEVNCSCSVGFSLAADNKTCTDVNECAVSNGGCDHICTNTWGSYTCACQAGYYLAANNKICSDVDECAVTNGTSIANCSHTCSNFGGGFRCTCPTCHNLSADNITCSVNPNGTILCDGQCIRSLTNDTRNCGACGFLCGRNEACSNGTCITAGQGPCAAGKADCTGSCQDILSDVNNCGGCNIVCPAGQQCYSGACASAQPTSYACGSQANPGGQGDATFRIGIGDAGPQFDFTYNGRSAPDRFNVFLPNGTLIFTRLAGSPGSPSPYCDCAECGKFTGETTYPNGMVTLARPEGVTSIVVLVNGLCGGTVWNFELGCAK